MFSQQNFQVNILLMDCNVTKEIMQARKIYRTEREPKKWTPVTSHWRAGLLVARAVRRTWTLNVRFLKKNCIIYRFFKITNRVQKLSYFEFQGLIPWRWVYWMESKNDGSGKISSVYIAFPSSSHCVPPLLSPLLLSPLFPIYFIFPRKGEKLGSCFHLLKT